MAKGLAEANKQVEAFAPQQRELKEKIELVDKPFLKVLDTAKTTVGQAIDLVAQEIRKLPREEGMDLASMLFGSGKDAEAKGEQFYRAVMNGEISMEKFRDAARAAGVDLKDGAVHEAEELQRKIDVAAVAAETRLMSAMAPLGVKVGQIKVDFMEISVYLAKAANAALELLRNLSPGDALRALLDEKGQPSPKVLAPSAGGHIGRGLIPESEAGFPKLDAGTSRKRYESYEPDTAAASKAKTEVKSYLESLQKAAETAKAELDAWGKGNVERQKAVALAAAEAAARKEGRALTDAERQKVEELATAEGKYKKQLDDIKALQQEINSAMTGFAGTIESAFDSAIVKGEKLDKVLKQLLQSLASSGLKSLLSGVLTGQGLFGNALGLGGQNGQLGGLFGGAASALGGAAASSGGISLGGVFTGLGALLAFDTGSWSVPSKGNFDGKGGFPALIHPSEMILPAGPAAAIRSGQASLGGGVAQSHNYHFAPVINAVDASGVADFFNRNGPQLMKSFAKEMRRGGHLGIV